MINFKKIKIEGFGSIIEPLEYRLDNPGLTVISGKVGAGKSTIYGALSWVLYGKLLKKGSEFRPWADILPEDFQGTKVEIKFSVNKIWYKVIRCNEYKGKVEGYKGKNRLILIEDGKETQIKGVIAIQKRIVEILGYSHNLFKNTLLFGQDLVRLINLQNTEQKDIFEEAFEVVYLAQAKKKAEEKRGLIQRSLYELQPEVDRVKSTLEVLKVRIDNERQRAKEFDETKEANILDLTEKHGEVWDKLTRLRKERLKLRKQKSGLFGVNKRIKKLEPNNVAKRNLEDTILRFELAYEGHQSDYEKAKDEYKNLSKDNPICPTCKRPLKDKDLINKKKAELHSLISEKSGITKSLKAKIEEGKKVLSSIEIKLALLREFKDRLKELERVKFSLKHNTIQRDELQKIYNELSAKIMAEHEKTFSKEILIGLIKERKEIRLKSKPQRLELMALKKELGLYEWVIKDPLSNSGIKAYVFSTMLELTNHELKKYSKALGYSIRFDVDLDSIKKGINTTIYKGNKPRAYEDFSGGQKNLVNLSTAFAINDTTTRNKGCNILLMDEIFEYLDRESIEKVTELLKIKAQSKCIHLITHDERFDTSSARVIQLELDDEGRTVRTS